LKVKQSCALVNLV